MNIILQDFQIPDTTAYQNPDSSPWPGYIGLFFLFVFIIGFAVFIIFYAKWLKYGPKYKRFCNNIEGKITGKFDNSGPKVQKGAVISNQSQVAKIEDQIVSAQTPQQLLAAQNKKIAYEKEVQVLQNKLEKDKKASLEKEQLKAEAKVVKKQDKLDSKDVKAKQKEDKKQNSKGSNS